MVVLGLLGGWLAWRGTLAGVMLGPGAAKAALAGLFVLGAWALVAALLAPRLVLPLYWVLLVLGLPVRLVLAPVLMGAVYFGILTPVALLSRLSQRRAFDRHVDPGATSYWVERTRAEDMERYFRPY